MGESGLTTETTNNCTIKKNIFFIITWLYSDQPPGGYYEEGSVLPGFLCVHIAKAPVRENPC